MLSCCYCQSELSETSAHCPSCKLTLAGLTKLLGPVPLLNRGLTDTTSTLSPKDRKNITKKLQGFESHFEACHLNIVLREFSEDCNLSSHLFWLFNTSGLSAQADRHGNNRDTLIGIDPSKGLAGIMVGYGLEPLLKKSDLDQLLKNTHPHLEAGDFCQGVVTLIEGLQSILQDVHLNFAEAFGLDGGPSADQVDFHAT